MLYKTKYISKFRYLSFIIFTFCFFSKVCNSQPCSAVNMGTLYPDTLIQFSGTVPSGNAYYWSFNAINGYLLLSL